jgi:uncharacterized repeat protein (TIGR01451 family)
MQNSIWKLVSLAGVVGVCFLLVLMAQNGLQQGDEKLAESGVPAGSEIVVDLGEAASGDLQWPDQTVGAIQWEPEQPQEDLPFSNEPDGDDPFLANTGQSKPLPSLTNNSIVEFDGPALPDVPEFGKTNLAAVDPFAAGPPTSFNPVDLGAEPFSAPPAELPVGNEIPAGERPDLRAIALALMQKSYQAIDDSELLFARDKAVAAGELSVAWGPLEESPAMLVARIDGMMNAARIQDLAEAASAAEPFSGNILPVSGEKPLAIKEPAKMLVTDFGPDPFVDTLPEPFNPLPTIDLPVLEDAPAAFEPFAATLPEPEQPVSLPTLDEPLSDPFPDDPFLTSVRPELAELKPAASVPEPALIAEAVEPLVNTATAAKPDVTIRKVAPAEAAIGEPLIYSIEISNNSETNASEVIVEDRIPTGCKLVGTIPQAELIGSKILWRLGRLPAKSEQKLLIKVIPLEEGEIGSVATVNFVAEVSTSTSVRQAAKPDIKLEVSNRETAKVGENVLFRFRIANEGDAAAQNVSLQDIVPVGFEHPAGKDVTYEIGDLPAGKAVDIDLELTAVRPGQHVNRAIVKSGKDSKVETSAAVKVVDDKGLTIQTPPSQPQPVGQKTNHEIRVTNESSQPISGAAVNVILPQELEFVSASDNGAFTNASNSIRWSMPVMRPGQTITRSTTVVPKTYGVHSSRVQLIQPDQPMEQSASLVEASGIAALRLTLEDSPATVQLGEDFNVEFSILNRGTGPDSNVQFSLVLPAGIDFVSARGPVRNLPPQTVASGRSIGFATIPEIGERASVDFQVTLRSRAAGRPKIRAEVRSDQLKEVVAKEEAIVILDATP